MRFVGLCVLFCCAALVADIIHIEGGRTITGKIVEEDEDYVVVKTKAGKFRIHKERIVRIERGSVEEIFAKRLEELEGGDIDGYLKLGLWARSVGLEEQARRLFKAVLGMDPENEFAHFELGHRRLRGRWVTEEEFYKAKGYVKYKGQWLPKEDVEKLQAGFVRWGDEWIRKEELEMAKKGYRRLEGKWVSEEEYYKAKGYVKYKGRWMPEARAERLKRREKERRERLKALRRKKQIKGVIKLECTFVNDATRRQMEKFANIVRVAARRIWQMTGGGVLIEEAHISDKSRSGRVVVLVNTGRTVPHPNGGRVYGYASCGKMFVAGECFVKTFVHEFGHAFFGLPDHYGTEIICIMNAGKGAKYMRYCFCDSCWQKLLSQYPGLRRPKKPNEFFGKPPEVKITITDN